MNKNQFRPTLNDALEDRIALSGATAHVADAVHALQLIKPPANEINPRFLIITGRGLNNVNQRIDGAFFRFTNAEEVAFRQFNRATTLNNNRRLGFNQGLEDQITARFDARNAVNVARLRDALGAASQRLPFGFENLNPTLQNDVSTQSTNLNDAVFNGAQPATLRQLGDIIDTARLGVHTDVNTYINTGLDNGDFSLAPGLARPV